MFRDVVCGMEVEPEGTEWRVVYHGETYYFCSLACQEAFEQEPERYLGLQTPADDRE